MNSIRKAIFPGLLLGSLCIVFLSMVIRKPEVVQAAGSETLQTASSQNIQGECSLSANFPSSILQWCTWIEKYSQEYQLDPTLVAAVILQESGGSPDAYSSSGAVGLMQVMPRDGLAASFMCSQGPCFSSRPGMQDLFEPEFNIAFGTGMLAGLVQRHGDIREALRAYGPMDVGYAYADIVLQIFHNYSSL
jgi:soluble lytic murein transglycosylase-like protein